MEQHFFETDESLSEIREAWEAGEKGVTGHRFTLVADNASLSGTDRSLATKLVGHVSEREVPQAS